MHFVFYFLVCQNLKNEIKMLVARYAEKDVTQKALQSVESIML